MAYIWYIPGIFLVYIHVVSIPGVYHVFNKWVCSVPVTYPDRHVICQIYTWNMTCLSGYVTGPNKPILLKTCYTPGKTHV